MKRKLLYVFLFATAFAFVEAAVVVYLRKIYYPEGFRFPLSRKIDAMLVIEIIREFSTIVMMTTLGALLARKFWEGFGYFLIIFGVWDIFFYIWLKAAIDWPESLFTFDILFLIPMPWIAPVIVPVVISLIMVIIGLDIVRLFNKGYNVSPGVLHWSLVLAGVAVLFYSFMNDFGAMFYEQMPLSYNWVFFFIGIGLFVIAHILLHRKTVSNEK